MLAVLIEIDLHLPAARSLKDKRGVIRRLQARLRGDLGVSVAEVGHQDLWQRSMLGVAIATADETTGRRVGADIERVVARVVEVEMLDIHLEVVQTENDGFSLADPRLTDDGGLLADFDVDLDPAGLGGAGLGGAGLGGTGLGSTGP